MSQKPNPPSAESLPGLPEDPRASYLGTGDTLPTQARPSEWHVTKWWVGQETRADGSERADEPSPQEAPGPGYLFVRPVARGGMGEVWEAVQVALDRTVAVKRISADYLEGENPSDARRRFRQEALISARLEHPNIIPVHDLGMDEKGQPLLAMKLVHGRPWNRMIDEDWELPVGEFLAKHLPILLSTSQAVAFAHARGVVHRDIKPAQVLVGEFGEVLLGDWGLAIVVDETIAETQSRARVLPTRETATSPSGTPCLMAPEQTLESARDIGPWTDIYLLGGTLYNLLTGTYPHSAPTSAIAVQKARAGTVEHPAERAGIREVPDHLARVCLKALAAAPQDRHASVQQFMGEIRDYLSGASRRRESEAICREVQDSMAGNPREYAAYAGALEGLRRAASMWPENPELPALRERCLVCHARLALANDDLVLARAQCERLPPGATRDALLEDTAAAEARLKRRERQRVLALRAAVILLLLVVVGSAAFSWFLRQEAGEAKRQGELAMQQMARAHGLVDYMIEDMADHLDMMSERDAAFAESIMDIVEDFIATADTSEYSREAWLAHARLLGSASTAFGHMVRYDKELEYARESLAIRRRFLPADHRDSIYSLILVGRALVDLSEYDAARSTLEEAAALLGALPSPIYRLESFVWSQLGDIEAAAGDWQAMEHAHRKGLEKTRMASDAGPTELAQAHEALAGALRELGRNTEALAECDEALRVLLASERPNRRTEYGIRNNRGAILFEMGEFAAAVEDLEWSLAERRRIRPALHPEIAATLNNLALCYQYLGRREEALVAFAECARIRKATGATDPEYAQVLHNEAMLLVELGKAEEAVPLFEESLAIMVARFGDDTPIIAGIKTSLARAHASLGDLRSAGTLLEETLAMRRRLLPAEHPHITTSMEQLGRLRFREGRLDESIALLAEAAGRHRVRFGTTGSTEPRAIAEIEGCLTALGMAQLARGDAAAAGESLKEIRERCGEPRSGPVSDSGDYVRRLRYRVLEGRLLEAGGRTGEAADVWRQLLETADALRGESDPQARDASCVEALLRLGRVEEARLLDPKASTMDADPVLRALAETNGLLVP